MSAKSIADYPERLFAHDMAEIYRVSLKRFYKLAEEGAFDFARIKPTVGRISWSRDRVKQHFDGEVTGLTERRRLRRAS
jgi:hypothetical protein